MVVAQQLMRDDGVFSLIMSTMMDRFRSSEVVLKDACGILINLSLEDKNAALFFMKSGIIPTFRNLMTTHDGKET